TTWKPGDPAVFNYTIKVCNNSATTPAPGSTLDIVDLLPQDPGTHTPYFNQGLTCPIAATINPPQPFTTDNSLCGASTNAGVKFTGFGDLPPSSCFTLTVPVTIDTTLPDGTQICNSG